MSFLLEMTSPYPKLLLFSVGEMFSHREKNKSFQPKRIMVYFSKH